MKLYDFSKANGVGLNMVALWGNAVTQYTELRPRPVCKIKWVCTTNPMTELPDKSYFDQHPLDEPSVHWPRTFYTEDGKPTTVMKDLNPVDHIKIGGALHSSTSVGSPTTNAKQIDCYTGTQGYILTHVVPMGNYSWAFGPYPLVPRYSGWTDHVSIRLNTALFSNGDLRIFKLAYIQYYLDSDKQRSQVSFQRSASVSLLWNGTWYSASLKDSQGKSVNPLNSLLPNPYPSGGTGWVTFDVANNAATEIEAYVTSWLSEVPLYATATRSGTKRETLVLDPQQPALMAAYASLDPLGETHGEVWRHKYSLQDLSAKAFASFNENWEGNGLAFVKDAPQIANLLHDAGDNLANIVNRLRAKGESAAIIDSVVKTAAKQWLQDHYGTRLTLADTKELVQLLCEPRRNAPRYALGKLGSQESGTSSDGQWVARMVILYDRTPREISKLDQLLKKYDLTPDLTNGWDMVPYSFVVDWFYNLSNIFEVIDDYSTVEQTYHLIGGTHSLSITRDFTRSWTGVRGELTYKYYRRRAFSVPPTPILIQETTNPDTLHLVEGAALVVANSTF